jgi:hypothetical protein
MSNQDSEERDTTAHRGRKCARLVAISSGAGEQTGASTVGGAPVGFSSKVIHGLTGDYWQCQRRPPLGAIYCSEHDPTVILDTTGGSAVPQTLRIEREEIFELIAGVFKNKIGEVFYDAGARLGRARERVTARELILDAVIETQEFVYVDSLEEALEIQKTLQPVSWKEHRREHVGRAVALGVVNVAEVANVYGVSRGRPYEWARRPSVVAWLEKTGQKSRIGREVDSMPLTKADMNELREELQERYEALHADVRATLAIVLEQHPNNAAVAAAVDEFLDGTLRN